MERGGEGEGLALTLTLGELVEEKEECGEVEKLPAMEEGEGETVAPPAMEDEVQ